MYIKLFKRDHFGHGFSNSPFQDAALEIRTRKAMHVCNSYLKIDLQ